MLCRVLWIFSVFISRNISDFIFGYKLIVIFLLLCIIISFAKVKLSIKIQNDFLKIFFVFSTKNTKAFVRDYETPGDAVQVRVQVATSLDKYVEKRSSFE